MSAEHGPPALFAFGDLDTGIWGAGWRGAASAAAIVGLGGTSQSISTDSPLRDGESGEWRIEVEGTRLELSPAQEDPGGGTDQLCVVRGELALEAERREFACLGWRELTGPPESGWESMRRVAAWFSAQDGLALAALRPPRATSHADDLVAAAVLGDGEAVIEDPRLSTTYAADGMPTRASIELWLGRPDSEDLYPLRAAGEWEGPEAGFSESGVRVTARLFRWRSRGREGAGVYLLGRRNGA